MTTRRASLGMACGLLALAWVACSRDVPARKGEPPPTDSAMPRLSATPVSALAAVWDTAAGSLFLLPGAEPSEAFVVDPAFTDSATLDTLHAESGNLPGAQVELLAAGDSALRVRVDAVRADSGRRCAQWPAVHLIQADGGAVKTGWQVAFPPGRVAAVPFDSLPALSHADSTRLTIALARLASTTRGDTAVAFRGRPYIVRQASRFTLEDGRRVVVAEVVRVVNQEANPQQEELFLLAESEDAAANAPYSVAYTDRQIGLEEAIETPDLLAVLRLHTGTWAALVRRDVGDGFRLVLLEREAPGRWHVRWRSAYVGC